MNINNSGWFVVSSDEINMYDDFIFIVFDTHNKSHYFIFNHDEMLDVLKSKNLDNNDRYHFYLSLSVILLKNFQSYYFFNNYFRKFLLFNINFI